MTPARKALELLSKNNWMFGLDMVKQSGGVLKRAMVYVHLLADAPRRREYQITSRGRAALLRDDL